jgi:hypothetical protein
VGSFHSLVLINQATYATAQLTGNLRNGSLVDSDGHATSLVGFAPQARVGQPSASCVWVEGLDGATVEDLDCGHHTVLLGAGGRQGGQQAFGGPLPALLLPAPTVVHPTPADADQLRQPQEGAAEASQLRNALAVQAPAW